MDQQNTLKTLTKPEMIDLMMLGQYLANSDDFARYIVELAEKRREVDKYDTKYMEIREVTCKLSRLVKASRPESFDIEFAYYLCKHFKEKVVLPLGDTILEMKFIKDNVLHNKLREYIRTEIERRLDAVQTFEVERDKPAKKIE